MLTSLAHAREDIREWTDQQGRTMQARYVEMRGDKVYLQRDDGRYFEFPLADLSTGDQNFLQEQLADKAEPETDDWTSLNISTRSTPASPRTSSGVTAKSANIWKSKSPS